ncbi:MAG: PIN domain-containing protein [Propionibacteriaceae bacterium]|nr:PIN domain-containing protein [Propionibacteriaceae bacterium]
MSAETFIDTNILAYAFDSHSPDKQAVAQDLIKAADFVTSAQVLGELYVTLTRKLADKVPPSIAQQVIDDLRALPVVAISARLVSSAIDTSIRYQLSYWDAMIIEAAASSGCTTLLTEDLSDGAVIQGVTIVNPFIAE